MLTVPNLKVPAVTWLLRPYARLGYREAAGQQSGHAFARVSNVPPRRQNANTRRMARHAVYAVLYAVQVFHPPAPSTLRAVEL